MGHASRNMEDAESSVNYGAPAQEVSEKNIIQWCRDHSCDILSKNVIDFCPCPKNLPEAKLKSFGLMVWVGSGDFKTAKYLTMSLAY